tara:strand:- start:164 stop:490 length:327 start_codon:yes stop_codon:yes gene_type:complete
MPAKPRPWHSDLENALAQANFGLPENYELRWVPLPPFDDWIVHVSDDHHDAAVIVTANQMSLSENLIALLKDNAAGRLMKIIATPEGRAVEDELLEILTSSSIHLLRY